MLTYSKCIDGVDAKGITRMPILRKQGILLFILFLFAVDQLSKWFVSGYVQPGEFLFLCRGFGITYKINRGVVFHIFEKYPLTMVVSMAFKILLLPVFLLAYRLYKNRYRPRVRIHVSFVFLISGMLGNLCDQLFLGYVRDFILWPGPGTPNFADVYTDAAVLCLVLESVRNPRRHMNPLLRSERRRDE